MPIAYLAQCGPGTGIADAAARSAASPPCRQHRARGYASDGARRRGQREREMIDQIGNRAGRAEVAELDAPNTRRRNADQGFGRRACRPQQCAGAVLARKRLALDAVADVPEVDV